MSSNKDGANGEKQPAQDIDPSKVDMSNVQWFEDSKTMRKKTISKGKRLLTYQVPDVGEVGEEWQLEYQSEANTGSGINEKQIITDVAIYSVYVNGALVYQLDLSTMRLIKSEPKFEPYSFLRYGPHKFNVQQQKFQGSVVGAAPANDGPSKSADSAKKS